MFQDYILTAIDGFAWFSRMAATAFHQAVGTIQAHGYCNGSRSQNEFGMFSARVMSKGVTRIETGSLKRRDYSSSGLKLGVIRASTSNTSVVDPVSLPSNNNASDSRKKSRKSFSFIVNIDLNCCLWVKIICLLCSTNDILLVIHLDFNL